MKNNKKLYVLLGFVMAFAMTFASLLPLNKISVAEELNYTKVLFENFNFNNTDIDTYIQDATNVDNGEKTYLHTVVSQKEEITESNVYTQEMNSTKLESVISITMKTNAPLDSIYLVVNTNSTNKDAKKLFSELKDTENNPFTAPMDNNFVI